MPQRLVRKDKASVLRQQESRPHSDIVVGRAAEIAQLEQGLEQALAGTCQIVFVSGEPGIGKTTLVETFLRQLGARSDVRIAYGQCVEQYGVGEAYLPLLEAATRLCQAPDGERLMIALQRYAPTWLVQLSAVLDIPEREALQHQLQGATQERMLREAVEALTVLTQAQTFVLFLDDLHWSDISTVEWLGYIARRQEPMRLLLIGTYRPTEVLATRHPVRRVIQELQVRNQCVELSLAPLSEHAVQEYLTDRFTPAAAVEYMSQALHRRTGGHPLFLTNVVDYLTTQGLLSTEQGWTPDTNFPVLDTEVPQSLRHFIEQQLERLDPDVQYALAVASVIGIEFSTAAVAAGLQVEHGELEVVEHQCEELAQQGLFLRASGLEEWPDGTLSGRFAFRHGLYQNVLYKRVPETRRVRLHRRIGERLQAAYGAQDSDIAAELAVHFEAGRDYGRAIQCNEASAQTALRRYAAQEALDHLTTALSLLHHLPASAERNAVELRLQTALTVPLMLTKGAAAPETDQTYTRARELCTQLSHTSSPEATPELFPILYGSVRVAAVRGDMPAAREFSAQLLEQATHANDTSLRIEAHAAFGASLFHCGEFSLALEQCERGLALYNREHHHGLAFQYGDDPGVVCQVYATWSLCLLGYTDQAQRSLQKVHTLIAAHPYPLSVIAGHFGACVVSQFLKDSDAVQAAANALEAAAREQAIPYWQARAWILDGWQHAHSSEADQAVQGLTQLQHGLRTYQRDQAKLQQTYFLALLAEAHLTHGQIQVGLQVVEEALALVAATGERWWEAELYRLKGEGLLAQESKSQKPVLSAVEGAKVTSQNEGEAAFVRALEIARQQQAKAWQLRSALSLSRLWHTQGKTDEARRLLEDIYSGFTEGFETPDVQQAEALLQTLGSRLERSTAPHEIPGGDQSPQTAPSPIPPPQSLPPSIFRREGDYWTVAFQGTVCRVKDLRGMRYLAHLLQRPHQEVHVLALVAAVSGQQIDIRDASGTDNDALQTHFPDAGELLDPTARAAYRQRMQDLQEELEEAQAFHDLGRIDRLQDELDFLRRELSNAVGFGGRPRQTGSAVERARNAVRKTIQTAISRLAENHPALGQHLRATIRTGAFCVYTPDTQPTAPWQT